MTMEFETCMDLNANRNLGPFWWKTFFCKL